MTECTSRGRDINLKICTEMREITRVELYFMRYIVTVIVNLRGDWQECFCTAYKTLLIKFK
jgi:hypothetical protein